MKRCIGGTQKCPPEEVRALNVAGQGLVGSQVLWKRLPHKVHAGVVVPDFQLPARIEALPGLFILVEVALLVYPVDDPGDLL